ncbi:MAG: ABC transporter ATP-binding protein/permease [Patescibacteria group bacterium]|nr:ABC transporter ATP-binding protein/permease [Patescibacteria group bacterium]
MYSTFNLIQDIWGYIRPYKWRFWWGTFLRVAGDSVWLYQAYALAALVDFFAHYRAGDSLLFVYVILALMVVSAIIRFGGLYLAKTNCYGVGERVLLDAELAMVKHLFLLDISWHEKENAGNKFKRVDRGASSLELIIRMWVNSFIEITINLIGVVFIIATLDTFLAGAIAVYLVSFYLIARFHITRAVYASNIVNAKEENQSGLIFESINNIRSIKVMSMGSRLIRIMSDAAKDLFESIKARIFWFQSGNAIRDFYTHLFRVGIFGFVIWGIIEGRYEVGFLVLVNGYFGNVVMSIREFTGVSQDFAVAKHAVARMQEILKTPITIDSEIDKVPFPKDWKIMSFKNLSFSYGNKSALKNITLEIRRGERVGVVGLSGAGKSTLFKLLLKEHESYKGDISFDNVSLRDISKQDYFNHLAVVLQDTELFNASLKDNITITNHTEEKNEKLLRKAFIVAHVKDFVKKMPKGMDSIIGEKGIRLSGGEKQRVGIARAVFKDPQILLLDEATSHLDIESEEIIRESLHEFFQSVTAIVIAHRLTTIKEMDRIVVIEDGKIMESGNFAELQKKKGRFYELWEKQRL